MTGWSTHTGQAVALDRESIDTDQLIPARFLSTPRSKGYGRFLMHDLRFDASGAPRADMPLNQTPEASVLVARRNFGSGSSREAAVYALVDFGIRVVIAPSFGDIFAANAVNNGLLPARVSDAAVTGLMRSLKDGAATVAVDLTEQTITSGTTQMSFELDRAARDKLINGWDDIDLTLARAANIAAYRARISEHEAWRFPAQTG